MQIHFIRHATLVIYLNGLAILVDPMLSPAAAMDPVLNAPNQRRFPLVDLPLNNQALEHLLSQVDAVLVTHTHRDHWDARARELLPKDLSILCQPEDEGPISEAGFSKVLPIVTQFEWQGLRLTRTGGRHGLGEIGQKMGPVSGFVLQAPAEPLLYLAGDTVWCAEVEQALQLHQPEIIIVNTGAAQFLTGGPITMTAEDVSQVCHTLPGSQVIAVHMETVNHCLLTRAELRARLQQEGLLAQVSIPEDGDMIEFDHSKEG